MTGRLVVMASGAGSNLQALLNAAHDALDASVVLVVVNRRDAPAFNRAQAHGVPAIFRPWPPIDAANRSRAERLDYDRGLAEEILGFAPDLVVLAGWMHVLSSAFLAHFPLRVLNLHPALPGTFPGPNAIDEAWAAFGVGHISETGVMVHLVADEGVDDGPVLASQSVPIRADDTRDSLKERIQQVEHELLVTTISAYLQGR